MCDNQGVKTGKFQQRNFSRNMMFTGFLSMLFTSGCYTGSLLLSSVDVNSIFNSSNPTSIPWIDNQSRCEQSGRIWRNDKCWDYQHNAMF